MAYKKVIAAAVAAALASSASMAAASGAPAVRDAAPAPASERIDAESALSSRTGILVPLLGIIAISAAVYFLLLRKDKDEDPLSA